MDKNNIIEFNGSSERTIGMEIEFQLLNSETLDLVNGIIPLMEHYPDIIYIKPEFIQSSVEVMSKVCGSIGELESNLLSLVSDLRRKCAELGITMAGAGTHPFNQKLAVITPLPRYLRIEERVGYPCHTHITYSIHVHLGMGSGEETIQVMTLLRPYLPLLLALSASSPFWWGFDTKYASYRQMVLASAKTYGLPPDFESWEHFCSFFNKAKRAGVFGTFRDYHWDLRPRPDFGTLEIRVMDTQPTVRDAIALAALSQCLTEFLKQNSVEAERNLLKPLPFWIEKENRYRACRWGLEAMLIIDDQGNSRPLREIAGEVLRSIRSTADDLRVQLKIDEIAEVLSDGPSYVRQRNLYETTASFKAVVSSIAEEVESELNEFDSAYKSGITA